MKIALDTMGGDNAPLSNINGAKLFLKNHPDTKVSVILVGNKDKIENNIKKVDLDLNRIEIVHAPDIISMDEPKPAFAFKNKPNSSLVKAIQLVNNNDAQAVVSAGNTAALLSSSLFILGKIKGIKRPTLATFIPTQTDGFILSDVGANTDVRPIHILQFGIMASLYIKNIKKIDNPRIGLLNIGSEENKGNNLTLSAYRLLEENMENFVGNIESRYILDEKADVILCDGFTGNIALKVIEGILNNIHKWIVTDKNIKKSSDSLNAIKNIFKNYNYEEHGASPFLGVRGIVLKCHGSCTEISIKNAIKSAEILYNKNIISSIEDDLNKNFEIFEKIDSKVN